MILEWTLTQSAQFWSMLLLHLSGNNYGRISKKKVNLPKIPISLKRKVISYKELLLSMVMFTKKNFPSMIRKELSSAILLMVKFLVNLLMNLIKILKEKSYWNSTPMSSMKTKSSIHQKVHLNISLVSIRKELSTNVKIPQKEAYSVDDL